MTSTTTPSVTPTTDIPHIGTQVWAFFLKRIEDKMLVSNISWRHESEQNEHGCWNIGEGPKESMTFPLQKELKSRNPVGRQKPLVQQLLPTANGLSFENLRWSSAIPSQLLMFKVDLEQHWDAVFTHFEWQNWKLHMLQLWCEFIPSSYFKNSKIFFIPLKRQYSRTELISPL